MNLKIGPGNGGNSNKGKPKSGHRRTCRKLARVQCAREREEKMAAEAATAAKFGATGHIQGPLTTQ